MLVRTWEDRNPYILLVTMEVCVTASEVSAEITQKKIPENVTATWPTYHSWSKYTKKSKLAYYWFMYTFIFITTLYNSQDSELVMPIKPMNEWRKQGKCAKYNFIQPQRKRNHDLCRKWMELDIIIWNETSQTQTDIIPGFLSHVECQFKLCIIYMTCNWKRTMGEGQI